MLFSPVKRNELQNWNGWQPWPEHQGWHYFCSKTYRIFILWQEQLLLSQQRVCLLCIPCKKLEKLHTLLQFRTLKIQSINFIIDHIITITKLYLIVQTLQQLFPSGFRKFVQIFPPTLNAVQLFFQRLLLQIRFVLHPLGSLVYQIFIRGFSSIDFVLYGENASDQPYTVFTPEIMLNLTIGISFKVKYASWRQVCCKLPTDLLQVDYENLLSTNTLQSFQRVVTTSQTSSNEPDFSRRVVTWWNWQIRCNKVVKLTACTKSVSFVAVYWLSVYP